MRTSLILQPFVGDRALVDILHAGLANDAFDTFMAVVAWARPSGLNHVSEALAEFESRGGHSEIVVGIDEGGASVEGLEMAREVFTVARVLYDPSGGTFHPKMYILRGPHEALVVTGSNNLTAGGLYFNYEAAQVLALDLALAPDNEVLAELMDYIGRLQADDTCLDLTDGVMKALIADPRFRVSTEAERKRSSKSKDDSTPGLPTAPVPGLFGSTKYKRKAFKSRSTKKVGSEVKSTLGGSSPEAGGSTAGVTARWTKKLTRSDCGQPRPGSHTTGALRFTKAGHPIKQATWFREVLFSDCEWVNDPTRPGRERASVRFDVQIYGTKVGTHVLALKYDPVRDAGQNNFTTDLKWGSLTPVIESQDLVGSFVAVERLEDGTFRMRVETDELESFLDAVSA